MNVVKRGNYASRKIETLNLFIFFVPNTINFFLLIAKLNNRQLKYTLCEVEIDWF